LWLSSVGGQQMFNCCQAQYVHVLLLQMACRELLVLLRYFICWIMHVFLRGFASNEVAHLGAGSDRSGGPWTSQAPNSHYVVWGSRLCTFIKCDSLFKFIPFFLHFSNLQTKIGLYMIIWICGLVSGNHLERFSNECRKTKTKVITPANHNRNKTQNEPIRNWSKDK